ncbi:type II secretion system protein GspC [Glaciecola siphonariae]|uniref:Type II secretion system protein GspC n=1 Tax=Glaciecola siphonariae TaxID=521012 RepID=A0ABV9LQM0_9ALTE
MTIDKLNLTPIAQFYQQNDKKIILAVVVVLALYLIAFAAQLTWQLMPRPESSTSQYQASSQQTSNVRANDSKTNLTRLLKLNLFGDAAAKPQAPVQQDVTDAPETKLNLILSGVVSSPSPDVGAAVIEYRNSQNTYGIGDKIEGTQVTLDEIYEDRVIIKNRVTRETLMLEGIDFEEANRLREQNQPIETAENDARGRRQPEPQIGPQPSEQAARIRQQLIEEPANFADFIRLSPYVEDGMPIGYKVSAGKDPSLFREVGLQEGDVVIELNGYDLSDTAQALEAVTLLNDAQSLDIEVLRNDEFISLNLEIPRD